VDLDERFKKWWKLNGNWCREQHPEIVARAGWEAAWETAKICFTYTVPDEHANQAEVYDLSSAGEQPSRVIG
jgi:hypothetical protein